METPEHRAAFTRLVASAKRAGLLKAVYEPEGLAVIEIPVPQAEAPAEVAPPAPTATTLPKV